MTLIHGSCVEIDGIGVLIRGPSGSGKSDLVFRLIGTGAGLVADDQSKLIVTGEEIYVSAPATISGKMEVRGIGIIHIDVVPEVRLGLIMDLVDRDNVPRLPAAETCTPMNNAPGIQVPLYRLHAFDASTPLKVRLAVEVVRGDIIVET
jgi:HPr kinase/phosphorylase